MAEELWAEGVDVLTMGNHTFDRKEIGAIIGDTSNLKTRQLSGRRVRATVRAYTKAVQEFLSPSSKSWAGSTCRSRTVRFKLRTARSRKLKEQAKIIFVDVHAEITSEKAGLAWYMDGRVTAAVGSHTHVQTADERILPGGTAFLTDAGACGPLTVSSAWTFRKPPNVS